MLGFHPNASLESCILQMHHHNQLGPLRRSDLHEVGSIVRQAIARHLGTCFYLSLPRCPSEGAEAITSTPADGVLTKAQARNRHCDLLASLPQVID